MTEYAQTMSLQKVSALSICAGMDNYGYLIADCSRLLRRDFDETVRPLGVTGPQARLLLLLDRYEGENQTFFAEMLDVEGITLCRMVDRMEESDLIARRPALHDRRVRTLVLTDRARGIVHDLREKVDGMIADVSVVLDEHEVAALHAVLTKLRQHLRERRAQGMPVHG